MNAVAHPLPFRLYLRMYAAVPTKSPPSATMMLSLDMTFSRLYNSFSGFKCCLRDSCDLRLFRKTNKCTQSSVKLLKTRYNEEFHQVGQAHHKMENVMNQINVNEQKYVPVNFLFFNVSFFQCVHPISWTVVSFETLRK